MNNNEYRIIQINNYIRTRTDYLKVKRAQKLSREIITKIQEEKKYNSILTKEEENLNICRICYDNEETEDNKLIRPCKCKGTQRWIHEKCLLRWLNVNINNPEKRDYCDICKYKFKIRDNNNESMENVITSINFNLDISKNYIEQNFVKCSLRYILLLIFSFGFSGLDMYFDLFSIKILSLGQCYDKSCNIYKNFILTNESNYDSVQGYMFFVYFTYMITLIFTIFQQYKLSYFYYIKRVKHGRFAEYYLSKMKRMYRMVYMFSFLFYMFFYLSYVTNTFFLMQFFSINLLFNIFNFEMLSMTHNGVIKDIETIILNNNINLRMVNNFRNNNVDINLDILEYSTDTSSETDRERKEEEKVGTVYDVD